jgi:hypothetical protein
MQLQWPTRRTILIEQLQCTGIVVGIETLATREYGAERAGNP